MRAGRRGGRPALVSIAPSLRSAVISGAGASGLLHALALRAAGVRIHGVWDPDSARAEALASATGAWALPSFEALLGAEAELAAVCSPPSVHVAQAKRLASAGHVVLVEKPVAVSAAELEAALALPRCVPILQWRAGRGLRALRSALSHGELGEAPVISIELAWSRDEAYFRARDETWGCGALLSIGIHALDAVTWALGRPLSRVAGVTRRRAGARHDTGAAALLEYAGGALVSLRLSLDGGADSTRITACGAGVTAVLAGGEADPTASVISWHAEDERTRARLQALEAASDGALGPPLLVPYLGAVVSALREGEAPGDSDRVPAIADTRSAHEAALIVASS